MTPGAVQETSQAFKKALIERALGAEMSHHVGYAAGGDKPETGPHPRKATSGKSVLPVEGALAIGVPRDRQAGCQPRLIAKHARDFTRFDDKIIAMYARGMT